MQFVYGLLTGLAIGVVGIAVMVIVIAGAQSDKCVHCRGQPYDEGTSAHVT